MSTIDFNIFKLTLGIARKTIVIHISIRASVYVIVFHLGVCFDGD